MEANKTIFLEDESPTLRQFNKFLRASRYTMMFVLEHWYQFCTVIVKKKINTDFFQITCFKESKNMAVEKNLRKTIGFYKKLPNVFRLSHGMKNIYRSKLYQYICIGEKVFCSCYFWWFVSRFFSDRVMVCNGAWSVRVFLGFSEKRKPSEYYL